ncbi:MAG: hemerythrin family protein [Clostridia bacterium]|nr:hemerythrin family protein [Clostridia bacterium]
MNTKNNNLSSIEEKMDSQHQKIFTQLNNLIVAYSQDKNNDNKESMTEIIDLLGSIASKHFKEEEAYMTKYSYPFYLKHKKSHDDFIQIYNKLKHTVNESDHSLNVIDTSNILINWLKSHILITDKILGKFLKTRTL